MSAGWKTPLKLEVIGHRNFRHIEKLIYETDDGRIKEAEIGDETDLGSTWGIPIVATLYDGCFPMSCAMHDKDYRTGRIPRKQADEDFFHAMYWEDIYYEERGQEGKGDEVRLRMYQGVRIGGSSSYKGPEEWNN